MNSNSICEFCKKKFSSSSTRNRHLKLIHKQVITDTRTRHIICPLCSGDTALGNYANLENHLHGQHQVSIDKLTLHFSSKKKCQEWMQKIQVEVNYAVCRKNQNKNFTEIHYSCNRSNITGHESQCNKRSEKLGGSIKIHGVCPSRLVVRFYKNNSSTVRFWKTHVGHKKEIRSQHLSMKEKDAIVEKLKTGMSVDQIIEDAKKMESNELSRINALRRIDIRYLSRKHNIEKSIHSNEMEAMPVKVQESNNNENAFCLKEGDVVEKPAEDQLPIKIEDEEKIKEFIKEKGRNDNEDEVNQEDCRKKEIDNIRNFFMGLDNEAYKRCMKKLHQIMNEEEHKESDFRKRKMGKQQYSPGKKKKR